MGIKIQRGLIEDLSQPGKDGSVTCRIGPYRLKAPRTLAQSFANGDEVMVAGRTMKDGVLRLLSVNNYSRGKKERVDITSDLMIFAVAAYVFVLCGVFGAEGIGGAFLAPVQDVASVVGLVVAAWAARRVIIIMRADKWLRYALLAEEPKDGEPAQS